MQLIGLARLSLLCVAVWLSVSAHAAVSLSGTRLIFDGKFREVSIEASNRGQQEVLLQAWLSDIDAPSSHPEGLPFVVTPPLVHLPPQGKQSLRLLYEGLGMPRERESLLHLYVMEIPRRTDAQQQLTIAVRQRINVFYRPTGLGGDPALAAQSLSWQLRQGADGSSYLQVRNPTPFHVSLLALKIDGKTVREDWLIKPGETLDFALGFKAVAALLSFKALTDYGGQRDYCAQLSSGMSSTAQLTTGMCIHP